MEETLKRQVKSAPRAPGVYLFRNSEREVIYVGKAKDLAARLGSYCLPLASMLPKTARMVGEAVDLETRLTGSELEALLLEAKLIRENQPHYNIQAKDDKQPLYIKITKEEFPRVVTARRQEIDFKREFYFGPFPSSTVVKSVLKMLRRVFPYCSQKKLGKRACFYSHIGLCEPCPSDTVKYEREERARLTRLYRLNIFRIKRILEGHVEKIMGELEREMRIAAKKEAFEEAAVAKGKIERLQYIVQRPVAPEDFLANPNLASERAEEGVINFWKQVKGYFGGGDWPRVAEAYDISNISGREAVGSQVTFFHGLPDKAKYKRYRVKMAQRPNDAGMMREVLRRRVKHLEWGLPGMILVDGGKPQVAVASEILKEAKLVVPIVGLAKRNEEVIVPTNGGFVEIVLKRTDPALHFVQRIRDEAHRFAQAYHHKLMRNRLKRIDER